MSGRVTQDAWGEYGALNLSSDAVSLTLVPDIGARIVSLRDRRSGREWLTSGHPPSAAEAEAWSAEGAEFGGRVSFGWDECLPTVAPCPDPRDPGAEALRDHGEQWGRPAPTTAADSGTALLTRWPQSRWGYAFSRRLSLRNEATVLAEYVLRNDSSQPMPVLWSLHPCLRLEPGSRLDLPSVDEVRVTWNSRVALSPGMVGWPTAGLDPSVEAPAGNTDLDLDLARVRSDEGWAAKLYASAPGPVRAVGHDGASLRFDWDRSIATSLGVWVAYGGWPLEGEPVEQVALEPTTSAHDDLQSAMADDEALVLQGGERLEWWVSLQLSV